MKGGLITLADIPELGAGQKPRSTIVVARLDDKLYDPRYGRFSISQSDVDGWRKNLSETFGGRVAIDFDHSSDRGRGTKAAAWITGLEQQGNTITADVEWTPTGAKSIRDGDYRYISPTFVSDFVDEHKESHGRALIGAALTNRPVLRKGMPTLSLSKDAFDGVATIGDCARERKRARRQARELAAPDSEPSRDSRGQMDLKALAKTLELPEDSDEATILAKVEELKSAPATPPGDAGSEPAKPEPTTLAAPNADGTITLSAEQVAKLVTNANAGAAAAKQLAEQTFQHAWDKALSEGRAAPSQEETLKDLFNQAPELAIKTLDSLVPIVPVKPTGSGDGAPSGTAPEGMDPDRYALHTEAKALAATKLSENPKLDPGEAYILATQEIEERNFQLTHPGI